MNATPTIPTPAPNDAGHEHPVIFPDAAPPVPPETSLPSDEAEVIENSEPRPPRRHGPGDPRKDNAVLAAHRARVAERSRLRVLELAQLIAREGVTWREAGERMGLSPSYVRQQLWPRVRELTLQDYLAPEEREAMRVFVIEGLKDVAREARARLGDHAAYGAVALNAYAKLAELFGVDCSEQADSSAVASLPEVGAEVKRMAPLLAGKLEAAARIRSLGAAGVRSAEQGNKG